MWRRTAGLFCVSWQLVVLHTAGVGAGGLEPSTPTFVADGAAGLVDLRVSVAVLDRCPVLADIREVADFQAAGGVAVGGTRLLPISATKVDVSVTSSPQQVAPVVAVDYPDLVYTRVRWSFPGGLPGPLNYSVTVAYRSPVTAQLLDSADCGQPCLVEMAPLLGGGGRLVDSARVAFRLPFSITFCSGDGPVTMSNLTEVTFPAADPSKPLAFTFVRSPTLPAPVNRTCCSSAPAECAGPGPNDEMLTKIVVVITLLLLVAFVCFCTLCIVFKRHPTQREDIHTDGSFASSAAFDNFSFGSDGLPSPEAIPATNRWAAELRPARRGAISPPLLPVPPLDLSTPPVVQCTV